MTYDDADLTRILRDSKVIAVWGMTPDPARPDNFVAAFLQARGKRVIPVNPRFAGQEILGEKVFGTLQEVGDALGETVDMVDIFRRSEQVPPVVDDALEGLPGLKVIWMQVGIVNEAAAAKAEAAGVEVIMDRCPKVEMPRLGL